MSSKSLHDHLFPHFFILVMFFVMTTTDILGQGTLPDNIQNADCTYTPEAFEWGIMEKWSSSVNVSTLLIPMVGDLDGDNIPEIVCFAPMGDDYYNVNSVMVFDSQTHEVIHTFTLPGNVSTVDAAPYGLVKLHDGRVMFAVCTQNYNMYGYDLTNHATSPLWTASTEQIAPNVGFADFNGDGYPEIYVGKRIYDAETGAMLIDAVSVSNIGGSYAHYGSYRLSSPFVANMLGDSHPELILGNEIYSINITNRTGLNDNTITLAQSCTPPSGIAVDGHTQVADFNLDGYLDVFISNKNVSGSCDIGCYVWDVHNNTVSQPLLITTTGGGKSIPMIADIDGDNLLEMVIQCRVSGNKIRAYKYNPTSSSFTMIWDFEVDEDSYSNGATTFDFNHDNEMEILISDQSHIKIVEGATGTTITQLSFGECTVMQYPIIADIDADGAAEIVICGEYGSGHINSGHLVVFCSSTLPWAPARKVWNQYMYNVTNVNEDLSIPTYIYNNATPFTWQGTTRRPYNNFLQQATIIDQHGNPFYAVPDAVIDNTNVTYTADNVAFDFTYSNQGSNMLNAPYTITVFIDQIGGTVLRSFTVNEPLISEVSVQQQFNISMEELCQVLNGHDIVIAVNCAGGGVAQDGGLQPECDVFNNIATIPLSIEPTETTIDEAQCDEYTWNGQHYTQSGDYSQTFQNIYGCDSIVTLHLTINYSENIDPVDVTECDAYTWNGTTYTQSGTFEYDTQTAQGCQHHETLNLIINHSEAEDFNITECDAYVWHGTTYTQSGTYTFETTTAQNCQRIETLYLTINQNEIEDFEVIECDSYTWHGTTYTQSGTYTFDTTTTQNCHRIETLYLTINHSEEESFYVTACDSYTWNGTTYHTNGTYTFETTTAAGCPRTETLYLTISDISQTEFSQQACENFTWNGTTYDASGNYTQQFNSTQGCDSIVTLHLTINHNEEESFNVTECDSYIWHGTTYTRSGTYTFETTTAQGCERIETLYLIINHSEEESFNITACDSYTWNGTTYNTSGTYTFETTTAQGCPRTETLNLIISDVFQTEFLQQACESFTWNGTAYNTSGDYTQQFNSVQGCDSIVTLHLTINDVLETEWSHQACDGYQWNDQNYNISGNYTQNFTSVQGCDSIVTLHLTINNMMETDWTQHAYNSFTWNDITYYESGDYTQNFITQHGCDSIVTLHLTIDHEVVDNEWTTSACDSYVWNGVTYNATGDYTQHFPSQHEGDSIVTLHLTVYHAAETEWSDQSCDSYEWNGMTYTMSGDYTQQFTTQHGCDSTVTLHLSLGHSEEKHINITSCDSYLWYGTLYTEGGTYEHLEHTTTGCDSLLVLHLNIGNSFISEESHTACDSYLWRGHTYSETGVYEDEAQNPDGCDSTFILNLTLNHSTTTHIEATACNHYEWDGMTYHESGTYEHLGQSLTGCDSIVVLHLTMEEGLPVNIQGQTLVYTATNLINGAYTYHIDSTNIDPAHVHWSLSRDDWQLEPHRASCKVTCLTTGEAVLRAWTEEEFCDIDTSLLLSGNFYNVDENANPSLSVYPNPTKGHVTISWHDIEEVCVIDMLGQKLATYKFGKVESCEVNIGAYAHGVYLLEIVSSDGKAYRPVVRSDQ